MRKRLVRLLDQRSERIGRHDGVEVEDEAVSVLADRLQGEDLRLHLRLEIQHEPHDARAVARYPQLLDVGIAGRGLAIELRERGAELHAFEIDHEPLGVLHAENGELDLGFRFERDARVIAGRPDACGDDLRLRC